MPIEGHPNYKTNWNYYLIGLGENAQTVPAWWSTATDTFIDPTSEDFKKYRWIKSLSEIPTEKDAETNSYWQIVKGSGWAVSEALNSVVAKPKKGDFNIQNEGDWKVDSASIYHDGKKWCSKLVYTLSGDAKGWDKMIYNSAD